MPRAPRHTVQVRIVDAFMAILPHQDLATITITDVCRLAGVNRSSFYQYFEDVADLDQRFLALYFHRTVGPTTVSPATMEELMDHYRRLVEAMLGAPDFFRAANQQPRLTTYLLGWRSLVEEGLRRYFGRPGLLEDRMLWDLHLEFALAVVHRYCELGFRGTSGFDLPTLSRWMIEFQTGGLLRLIQKSEQGLSPTNPKLDALLSQRKAVKAKPPGKGGSARLTPRGDSGA